MKAGICAFLSCVVLTVGSDAGDFIRVTETEEVAKLQTAIFGYEKDGVRVDLIGAIHIGDKRYYEFLNKYFTNYEVLLFEMVGGENLGGGKKPAAVEEKAGNLDFLRKMYEGLEKGLGLAGQGKVVDYFADNFVHADLTMEEFQTMQEEKGESLLGFMIQAGMAGEKPERQPNSLRMLQGLIGGRKDLLKLEMMKTMEGGDTQIGSLVGENVIISERNARCMEVMDGEIGEGRKKIGIFYGAAHFPDMEKRLEARGFKLVSKKWLTAWWVRKG
ncbi:MAG: hypothetical protein ACSHX7_14600 [Luteolibacter sp.]